MTYTSRQWLLQERPTGALSADTFRQVSTEVSEPKEGEAIIKTLCLSFDPAMRAWLDDVKSYLPPVQIGEPMRAPAVGQVVSSKNADYPDGTLVTGLLSWSEFSLQSAEQLQALRALPEGTPPSMVLSVMGGTSMTAYFGLLDVGRPIKGDTVLVSGAAGATGSVVCQIARLKGCKVIGIAGGAEKCAWLKDACQVEHTIDYKNEDIDAQLKELAPEGINLFFDNVGGETLNTAMAHMADFGRIVMCGAISEYNDAKASPGPSNIKLVIMRRLRIEGFIMLDYLDRAEDASNAILEWVMAGEIKYREDIAEGFDNIPATLQRLFDGANRGKQLLSLAEPT